MNSKLVRDRLLASTIIAGALVASSAAMAQQAAPATGAATAAPEAAAPEEAATIVVTGSRIPQSPNLTSPSPITVVTSAEVQMQGATRIEDVINNLPQVISNQASSVSNGSDGTANADLRNLGPSRTLVLINGRRLMPGDPSSSSVPGNVAADLNMIPTALIKRVDVLTGGASSVYGSDAVAGVVNFVMDTDFTGISLDSNMGLYAHDNSSGRFQSLSQASGYPAPRGGVADGRTFDATLKLGVGTEDGRGHIVTYIGYRKINPILQADRDYSSCGLGVPDEGNEYVCSGSPNANPANFFLGNGDSYGVRPGGALGPQGALNLYNANPLNYYQRPDTRFTAGFFAHYDVSDAFKPYAEFNFMDDHTVAEIAPSGLFAGSGSISTLNCDNPLLSAAEVSTICAANNLVGQTFTNPDGTPYQRANVTIGRRDVEGGARQADFRHTSYRFVAGAKGDVGKGISYDVYGQYGSTVYSQVYRNELSRSRVIKATDVITDTRAGSPTFGQPVCRSVVDGSDPTCVPLNIFGTTPITPAALNYVEATGLQSGETRETVVSGSVTVLGSEYGLQSPWAQDGIGLNVGAEYRKESVHLDVDDEFLTGDLTGQGGPTTGIDGSFDVKELFAEVQVPIVSDRPFFSDLTLNGGYRFSHYSTAGSVSAYKGELVWAPVSDIRFRGGYNRAVRAPNTSELFSPQSVQLDGATDPCSGATPSFTLAQCSNMGVTASEYGRITANPAAQYQGLLGGNPQLKPEKADTFTAGVVVRPSFLPGFSASVDAFSIKVKNLISQIGADTILNQCGLTGDPTICSLVHRDSTGSLWLSTNGYVVDTNLNTGTLKTRGIDVSVAYNYRTSSMGSFGFSMAGTYTDEFRQVKAGADFDCVGYYGAICGSPQSKWRHNARVTWNTPWGFGLSTRWRYFSPVRLDSTSSNPSLAGDYFYLDRRIKAESYIDLTLTARVGDRYNFRIGVNNLFDKQPPILSQDASPIGSFGNGNTYPGTYDAAGRYLFIGFTVDM